ncbi:hypothetical protein MT391_07550 [Vibrio sp. 1-Bac 57]
MCAKEMKQKIIDVSNHGVVPNTDITLKLSQLLFKIKGMDDIKLFFPKGVYQFYKKHAMEAYKNIANHDDGLKRIAFLINNMNSLSIDGDDSLFLFYDEVIPFAVDKSKNFTIKNVKIDFIMPFHSELEIVTSDPEKRVLSLK